MTENSCGSRDYVRIDHGWSTEIHQNVSKCVVCRLEEAEDEYTDPTKHSPEPVDLTCPDDVQPCSIKISVVKNDLKLTAIDVLCTARRMELYGQKDEYLSTAEGMYIESDTISAREEEKFYLLQHTLAYPSQLCTLKIVSLVKKHRLCIHSIHLTFAQSQANMQHPLLNATPSIDVSKVKAIMKDMHKEIPANAHGILASMENTQRNKESMMGLFSGLMGSGGVSPSPAMAAMMQMMSQVPSAGGQVQYPQMPPSGGYSQNTQENAEANKNLVDSSVDSNKLKVCRSDEAQPDVSHLTDQLTTFALNEESQQPNLNKDRKGSLGYNETDTAMAVCKSHGEVYDQSHVSGATDDHVTTQGGSPGNGSNAIPKIAGTSAKITGEHKATSTWGRTSYSNPTSSHTVPGQNQEHSDSGMNSSLNIAMMLPLLESRFTALLKQSEERITQQIANQISESETRILQKLENMMKPKGET